MIKGFKEFVMRGNVIDLAIAVVLGTAFAALVKSFTDSFVQPIINVIMGGGLTGGTIKLDETNRLLFGNFLNAAVTFLITAAVVYFAFVVPMKTLAERHKRGEVPAPSVVPDDVALLREIRDLLAQRSPGTPTSGF
ncbi:large conductance mechanosensitive channel protein MscL [Sporichthya sp.]|uniref:large conductance mechanosensitive channel protein MscL n=1 Tax=Sporichthya sp. TaxID=65475 RepID=UPI0017B60A86|nr:large conductance mechanosensitive channel protein MscL [Sporichthya sp.]MBA3743389.1 large conductance mechanosensitive channel protein MscL [Sporichthya sp.]